jgi:hypothetical protein
MPTAPLCVPSPRLRRLKWGRTSPGRRGLGGEVNYKCFITYFAATNLSLPLCLSAFEALCYAFLFIFFWKLATGNSSAIAEFAAKFAESRENKLQYTANEIEAVADVNRRTIQLRNAVNAHNRQIRHSLLSFLSPFPSELAKTQSNDDNATFPPIMQQHSQWAKTNVPNLTTLPPIIFYSDFCTLHSVLSFTRTSYLITRHSLYNCSSCVTHLSTIGGL